MNDKYYYMYSKPKSNVPNKPLSRIPQPVSRSTPSTSDGDFRCKSAFGFYKDKGMKTSKASNPKPNIKLKGNVNPRAVAPKSPIHDTVGNASQTHNSYDAYASTSPGRPKSARPSTRRGVRQNNMGTSFETIKTDTSRSPKKESKPMEQRPKSARPESRRSSYQRASSDIQLDFDDLNVDPVKYFLDEGVDTFFVNNCLSAYNASSTQSTSTSDRKLDNTKSVIKATSIPDRHGNDESKGKQMGKHGQHNKRSRSSSLKYLATNCPEDQATDLITMDTPRFRTRVRSDSEAISYSNTDNEISKWKKADKPDIKSLQFHEKRCTAAAEKVLAKYTKPPPHPSSDKSIGVRRSSGASVIPGSTGIGMATFPRKLKPIGIQRESSFLEIE